VPPYNMLIFNLNPFASNCFDFVTVSFDIVNFHKIKRLIFVPVLKKPIAQ
jgi:hypothetical protein